MNLKPIPDGLPLPAKVIDENFQKVQAESDEMEPIIKYIEQNGIHLSVKKVGHIFFVQVSGITTVSYNEGQDIILFKLLEEDFGRLPYEDNRSFLLTSNGQQHLNVQMPSLFYNSSTKTISIVTGGWSCPAGTALDASMSCGNI